MTDVETVENYKNLMTESNAMFSFVCLLTMLCGISNKDSSLFLMAMVWAKPGDSLLTLLWKPLKEFESKLLRFAVSNLTLSLPHQLNRNVF